MARVIEELDRLALSQAEIKAIVSNSMQFLASLEFTLREGLPQEKLVAIRQCIEPVHINKPDSQIKLTLKVVPSTSIQTVAHCDLATLPPTTRWRLLTMVPLAFRT